MSATPSLRALALLARVLPARTDGPLSGVAAGIARLLAPERHAGARANAAALFPDASAERLGARAGAAYARFLIEYLRELGRGHPDDPARNELEVGSGVREALAGGRGMVMCTLHLGNWEMGARALHRFGRPLRIVAEPQYARAWRDEVVRSKRATGMEVVSPSESPRALVRFLRDGGILGLLVDGSGFARGTPARLAGHDVLLPAGPARLSALSGAVLTGGTCLRVAPDRFRTAIGPLAGTEIGPVTDVDRLHAAMARWLEQLLLAHPGEWCIFRRFFDAAPLPTAAPAWRTA